MSNARARDEEQYTASYMPPIATDQVVGGESEATQAYNVSMSVIGNPTEVTSKDINRAINVTGSVATLGVGAVNPPAGTVVGGVFVAANTGYGIYAEYEKDKLRV